MPTQQSVDHRRLLKCCDKGFTRRQSCDTCHRSKTRCDRKRPTCSTCLVFNRNCTYKHQDEHGTPSLAQPELKEGGSIVHTRQDLVSQTQAGDYGSGLGSVSQTSQTRCLSSSPPVNASESGLKAPELVTKTSVSLLLPRCGWCLQLRCAHCQLLAASSSSEVSGFAAITQMSDNDLVARALLHAMASTSNQDSTTILAAIRLGTPWGMIHDALVSETYPKLGLAHAMQIWLASSLSASGQPSIGIAIAADDISSKHYHPNSTIFNTLRYPRSEEAGRQPPELIGTTLHRGVHNRFSIQPLTSKQRIRCRKGNKTNSDLRLPTWSILPLRLAVDTDDPFGLAYTTIEHELATGIDVMQFCGEHAYVGAFVQPQSSERVPRLSEIVAGLVRSIMPYEEAVSVTTLAVFWLHWSTWSWMLAPSPESFEHLPQNMRPTPWQKCSPHTLMYNFVISAALRDRLCRAPLENNAWVTEAASTIRCHWPKTTLHALVRHITTKALDLSPECKQFASDPESWSLGQSIRAHLPDIDTLMTVRSAQQN